MHAIRLADFDDYVSAVMDTTIMTYKSEDKDYGYGFSLSSLITREKRRIIEEDFPYPNRVSNTKGVMVSFDDKEPLLHVYKLDGLQFKKINTIENFFLTYAPNSLLSLSTDGSHMVAYPSKASTQLWQLFSNGEFKPEFIEEKKDCFKTFINSTHVMSDSYVNRTVKEDKATVSFSIFDFKNRITRDYGLRVNRIFQSGPTAKTLCRSNILGIQFKSQTSLVTNQFFKLADLEVLDNKIVDAKPWRQIAGKQIINLSPNGKIALCIYEETMSLLQLETGDELLLDGLLDSLPSTRFVAEAMILGSRNSRSTIIAYTASTEQADLVLKEMGDDLRRNNADVTRAAIIDFVKDEATHE